MKIKILFLIFCCSASQAFAESIALSTGEVIDGNLVEFPKDVTIQLQDGTKKTVPYLNITSIYKNLPPQTYTPFLNSDKQANKKTLDEKSSSSELLTFANDEVPGPYSSPIQTFQTWKNAALQDDIDGMSNCYVTSRKGDVKKDLKKLPKKSRDDMKRAMIETIFTPSQPYYQGELAIMEVSWTKGLASQTQTLKFSLEGNKEWKILE